MTNVYEEGCSTIYNQHAIFFIMYHTISIYNIYKTKVCIY